MNQSHPNILILGYSETAMLLAKEGLSSIGGLVSIRGQRDPYLQADIGPRLDLSFDDTPPIDESDEIGRYRARELRRKAADVGLRLRPPSEDDVEAIIGFSERLLSVQRPVLFQCFAGISRSAGAALVALSRWHGPGNESISVQSVLTVRPAAQPHMGLVRLADTALSRNGRLVAEVERVQKERL